MEAARSADLIDAAARDRTSGSSQIVLGAAAGLAALAAEKPDPDEFAPAFLEAARVLLVSQPVMASLWRLVNDCLIQADAEAPEFAADAVRATAKSVVTRHLRRSKQITHELAALAPEKGVLATTSASSTIEAALCALGRAGRLRTVYCLESQPGGEGAELARRLRAQRLRAEAVPDAAAGPAVEAADLVVAGADAVGPDWIVNKVGTRPLAALGLLTGKRVVVVADTAKLVPHKVVEAIEARVDTDPVRAHFEAVPWRDLGGWVSEDGLATPATVGVLAEAVPLHSRLEVMARDLTVGHI